LYDTEVAYVITALAEKQFHTEGREFAIGDWWYNKPAPIQYIITNAAYTISR
jgi:hypothetical protein